MKWPGADPLARHLGSSAKVERRKRSRDDAPFRSCTLSRAPGFAQAAERRDYDLKLPTKGIAFAVLLGVQAALPPLSIDMPLPALVSVMHTLHTTPSLAGLTLSLFMAGFAVSPLVYGPLADRYGRRPLLLGGLTLFVLGGLGAASAPSIGVLLITRLVQGAGAGAGMTLAFAIVRDVFEGKAAQIRLAAIAVVGNVAPIVAPTIGAMLLGWIGWRGIYGVTALMGVLLLGAVGFGLAETLPRRNRARAVTPAALARDWAIVLGHRGAITHILVNGLGFGWMFAYVTGSPLLFLGEMHLPAAIYAGLFACTGSGIVAGALLNARLADRGIGSETLLRAAILGAVAATLVLVALTATHREVPLLALMPLLVLATGFFGLATPSASHGALDPMPELAGIAGGLLTSVQMLGGALASLLVSLLFPLFGASAMSGVMAASALAALAIYRSGVRRPIVDVVCSPGRVRSAISRSDPHRSPETPTPPAVSKI
jgi:DHA1 family bicyclomycin/chloramphenicol resistance-like MFS transporter